ncbi:MAG: D-alanyl-D-alanine carboxypeptidase [Ruminococcus sp.]|nr:D-alanyl-D-alanine carboxypeptidase [Ruminococcus sp.]
MKLLAILMSALIVQVPADTVVQSVSAPPADISAKAAVLIEAKTGRVVWGKNENTRLPMASTTKIMSALITLESGGLDEEFTVDSEAVKTEGSSMGLREGDIVSKRDLCIGMLLPSGNDAANCAAVRVAGDIPSFAELMNRKAASLGLVSTHFVTPSGLHDDGHYSTAYDMAQLASYALKNPEFREICGKHSVKLSFGNPPYDRWLTNTNKLLDRYEGCIGVKTGFTDEAGRCLVSAAERDGVTLVCVTLNAPDDWNDHEKLLDYGFTAVANVPLEADPYFTVGLAGSSGRDNLTLIPCTAPVCPIIKGTAPDISWKIAVPQFVYAPVEKGRSVGTLIIYDGGREIDRIPLISAENVPYTGGEPPRKGLSRRIVDFFKERFFSGGIYA